ncbi:MAG TPA: hypothetical protein VGR66_07970 [Candidatus Eisenbacteria bacterium]|jgi:hypothetical protein|nr:hypothetical protein [Candidatus Eisenbacteria bacterium]
MIRRSDLVVLALVLAGCAKQPESQSASPASKAQETSQAQEAAKPRFIAPHRGDILLEGHTFIVRWEAPGWQRVNVAAAMGGKDRGHLVMARDAALDTLTWQIPVGWVTGYGPTRFDSVRLRLENADDPSDYVDSEPFTVSGVEP